MLRCFTAAASKRSVVALSLAGQARLRSTTPEKETSEPKVEASAAPSQPAEPSTAQPEEKAAGKTQDVSGADATATAYRFPTEDVLNAVKKGDFGAVQSHASALVQKSWRDEYTLPAACAVVFIVAWYWMAWTRRSIRRKCALVEANTRDDAQQTVAKVTSLVGQWKKDMSRANTQMQGILDKNSQLTKDIDRMTTALRSCSIRPTPGLNGSGLMRTEPTVDKIKTE